MHGVHVAARLDGNQRDAAVELRKLDLNLLVVFDAIASERSVTKAAERLHLSQPAVSHALERLRGVLRDELFVPTKAGMMPTARAEQLAPTVHKAMEDLGSAIEGEVFHPRNSSRRFGIAVNNYAAIVLVAPILHAAQESGPAIRLDIRPSGTLEVSRLLDRGDIDIALVNQAGDDGRHVSEPVLRDPFVALARRGHPAMRNLTLLELAKYPHLDISSSGEDTRFVDAELAEAGLQRRIGASVPFLATPQILRGSDMLAIVSRGIAFGFADLGALTTAALPMAGPEVAIRAIWHTRNDRSPAHRWLRQLISLTVAQGSVGTAAPRRSGAGQAARLGSPRGGRRA